jgi:phosphonate transport system ATP-binding protein
MFDGAPAALTAARIRDIYGVSEDEFDAAPEMTAPALAPAKVVPLPV